MTTPFTAAELQSLFGLDDLTRARLEAYVALLREWQGRFNLVGPATLADPWRRHVLDSAQLFRHVPPGSPSLVDLGSGAGFPGLVLAILGAARVTLVEATGKKCRFLEEVARATGTAVEVVHARAENLKSRRFDVVTARAVAPLSTLLGYAGPILAAGGRCLFLKGASVERELTAAARGWKMTVDRHPSLSHPDGVLLELKNVRARAGS